MREEEGEQELLSGFFVSRLLSPWLIYTHTYPNLWSREQNRDGRWSRILSELLAAHLLQSRQQDMSHGGPNSLYLAITHFLTSCHASMPTASLTIQLLANRNQCARVRGERKLYPGTNLSSSSVNFSFVLAKPPNSMGTSRWCISWI